MDEWTLAGDPPAAHSLAQALMLCGLLVAIFNSAAGTLVTTVGLAAFTNSPLVAAAASGVAPLFVASVALHCCSMGTEGILLAGRDALFLLISYVANLAAVHVRSHLPYDSM